MDTAQEEAFVRAFIVPEKQDRYLQLLANPKKRGKILKELYHTLSVVGAHTTRVAGGEHFPEPMEKLLRGKGAGLTCYLLSPEAELDQHDMPLREALDTLLLQDRVAIACCLPGRLAYYKAEDAGYVLEHKPTTA